MMSSGPDVLLTCYSLTVGAVYVYTMYRSIPGGDSGELIAAAHELGVAHPPGYPLFTLLTWLSIKMVPYGSVAWRANFLNTVLSALATSVFSFTLYRYTHNVGISVFGASLWSFGRLTWTWATCVEVFSLNNLFVATLLYLMFMFEQAKNNKKTKVAYVGALVCGLSLCNQHTSVVYVAVISVWVLFTLAKLQLLTLGHVCMMGMCFLLGLVPYIYLPLASMYRSGRWTWGDQSSLQGFLKHLLRQEYGTFSLAKGQDSDYKLLDGLMAYVSHVLSEYTVAGVVLAAVGAVSAIKRQMSSVIVSMVMCFVYLLLFSWRANLSLSNPLFHGVVERFWMQSDIIVVLLATLGLYEVFRQLEEVFSSQKLSLVEMAVAVAALSAQLGRNFSECNQQDNTVVEEFGLRLFHNMPQNALVLTVGDLPSNVLRYLYLCENGRPDVVVLDQELMTYEWFVPMLRDVYPSVNFPGHHMDRETGRLDNGELVFNFKTFLDANYDRHPILGCIGVQSHEDSWKQGYYTFPYGPCSLLVKAGRPVDLKSVQEQTFNISAGWKFDAKSWERVASDEMWNAKVNIAYQLFDMALKLPETDPQYQEFVTKSFQLYKAAIDREELADIPDYWHRNYALACERMLRIKHSYSNSDLLQNTITHFELYVKKNPSDDSVSAIKQSIRNLKKYIGKL